MLVQRGYKTELDPNNKQRTLLAKNVGAARYAYNWALNIKREAMAKREKIPNAIELHRQLNELKQTELGWMYEVSKCSPQEALRNCDTAFKNFFLKCKKKVKGKKGFPKFKSKKNGLGSFRLTGTIKVSDTHIQLPRIGKIKLKERGYLHDGKILSATVSERSGRWFVSLQMMEEIEVPENKPQWEVGVDLGIKTLATCNDGEYYDNPKALRSNLKKLQRLARRVSRKQKGGKNRKKAQKRLAKLHYRIACIRSDTIHKLTSSLTKNKSRIVIEDLNVSGMMKNRRLSRAIADIGLFEVRRQLEYKGKWYGCEIDHADRFYPSSKRCSSCGFIKNDLQLSDRVYVCPVCGLEIDRDVNAAINLLNHRTASSAGNYAFGERSSGSTLSVG